jgi:hypothetical protein
MRHRIEFADGLMMVMDDENKGYDAHLVDPEAQDEAERKIDEWAAEYTINVARAKRELRELIRQM